MPVNRALAVVVWVLMASAAVLRLAGVYDDFWLDEIWSWRLAGQIYDGKPWQILLEPHARYDNNHPLNTYFIWVVGRNPGWSVYRLPALVAGVGSIMLAHAILRRRGRVEAIVGVVLFGFSYPLIFFSSEARGYALAVFFALLAFDAMERYFAHPHGWRAWGANLLFVAACVLGILSHLTFIHFYAGVLVWSLYRWIRDKRGFVESIRFHLLPIATLVGLYSVFVRHLTIGGAPEETAWEAIVRAISSLLGAVDVSNPVSILLIAGGAVLLAMSLVHLRRSGQDWWILVLVTVIISPVLVVGRQLLLAEPRQPIAARYFLVPFAFMLLSLSMLLADWLRRRDALRVLAVLILVAFLASNLAHTVLFLRIGRGHYLDAVAHISAHTPHRQITVLSDHPWRTAMVLDFYQRYIPPHQRLVVYDGTATPVQLTHGPPMWLIVHSNLRHQPPVRSIEFLDQPYLFDREFTYYGLSGYSWYVYRHGSLGP